MKKFINLVNLTIFVLVSMATESSIQAGSGKSWGLFGGGVATGVVGTKLFSGRKRRYHEPERVVVREVQTVQQPVNGQLQAQLDEQSQLIRQLQRQITKQNDLIADLEQELKEARRAKRRALRNANE